MSKEENFLLGVRPDAFLEVSIEKWMVYVPITKLRRGAKDGEFS